MLQHKIAQNKRNTALIMAAFVGLIGSIIWIINQVGGGSLPFLWLMIGGVVIYSFVQYFFADKLALKVSGARPVTKTDNARLWQMVSDLSRQLNIPMPRVYIMDDAAPNAFATGRNPKNAAVAATTGLLEIMDDRELRAVLAHEMGHVQNYDIRVTMIAFGLTSVISILADAIFHMFLWRDSEEEVNPLSMLVGAIMVFVAPIVAMFIQFAVSRQREYLADATGANTTGDPEGLARALGKLRDFGRPMVRQNTSTAHLFIANPLKAGSITKLFSTHPPLEDRIARLRGYDAK